MRRVQRLGVAGLGPAGQLHAANIATLPTARLQAVASRRPGVAEEFARRYDVARAYTDYAELFADGELDAVVIASAGAEHPDHISGAAKHGRHIFTEKPIGFTLESIDQAVAAVRDAGVHLQVGFMRRFDPGYAQAKERSRRERSVVRCSSVRTVEIRSFRRSKGVGAITRRSSTWPSTTSTWRGG